jgi:hypothetical protein
MPAGGLKAGPSPHVTSDMRDRHSEYACYRLGALASDWPWARQQACSLLRLSWRRYHAYPTSHAGEARALAGVVVAISGVSDVSARSDWPWARQQAHPRCVASQARCIFRLVLTSPRPVRD